ncbi:putative HTH-type transcriptional regulator YobV [Bacillus sp. J14TS2]|nr:putative HTH-type transcriptional regulator YobV [Bacillus sp. J14TS2]
MKLDRLLRMIMLLLDRKKVTAQELAEELAVSVRTVYRDIDTLSSAGIPVVSYQGANGGISLIENYRIDKHFLKEEEFTSLSAALKSLLTAYEDPSAKTVLEKISHIVGKEATEDYLFIDDSPWGQDEHLKQKRTFLKTAIETNTCVEIVYGNRTVIPRIIEPHTLVQKGRSWYVYSYCLQRQAFRLFKLARIKDLQWNEQTFQRKEVDVSELPWDKDWYDHKMITLTLTYQADIYEKMEELFGVEAVDAEKQIVTLQLPENQWLYGFLLSFSDKIEVLEPKHIREIIQQQARNIFNMYKTLQTVVRFRSL